MSEPTRSNDVIVQIKVRLLGVSKPQVWRRLQLRADTRLDHLHEMLIAAFGWHDYHMHCFSSGSEEFGVPDPELGFGDERRVALSKLLGAVGDRLRYTYDFGDDWQHEEILADPRHEQHQEMLDWLGLDNTADFDPAAVAADRIEEELAVSSARR